MIYNEHIAGEWDAETKMQICIMCGALLLETNRQSSLKLSAGAKFITDNFNTIIIRNFYVGPGDLIKPCHQTRFITEKSRRK